jgi:predicted CXXCH cytochrome family protein
MQGPLGEDIAVAGLRIGKEGSLAVGGHRSMGANPDQEVTLPPDSYTEQEFTVMLTMDAQYLTGYELRITDGGVPLVGTDTARIRLGEAPELQLSPGQQLGLDVGVPTTTPSAIPSSAGSAFPAVLAASSSVVPASSTPAAAPSGTVSDLEAVAVVSPPNTVLYPLLASVPIAAPIVLADVHGPYPLTLSATDQCGICHRSHTAQAPNLIKNQQHAPGSQSALCFTCHDGTGANTNVQAEYALVRPANNPATREFYSHDAVAGTPPIAHTESRLDEFGVATNGLVINRHSECSDCHNPHQATAKTTRDSTQTTTGWDSSGRLAGVSGVSVVNGATGTSPTYTFLSGVDTNVVPANLVTREYQLCFKCHSGFTTLTSNTGLTPSKYALDKGVEFNPANPSFHPVEAAGKNTTTKMADSLAGTSPYKLWNFAVGSTIRCLNCHTSSSASGSAPLPQPGSALQPHTSTNRGILIRNYKDRVLETASAAYSAGDFALCYVCHAEAPFSSETTTATNFKLHGLHVMKLQGKGSGGTDIDTPGAGQGNAICAECHFRLHSTTNKVGAPGGSRLVNFAPNVTANGGVIKWTPGSTGSGSCTLTCHDKSHSGESYSP